MYKIIGAKMKTGRWKKCPSWVNWSEISKRLTEKKRKKEFVGRLKQGKKYGRTESPGPY